MIRIHNNLMVALAGVTIACRSEKKDKSKAVKVEQILVAGNYVTDGYVKRHEDS